MAIVTSLTIGICGEAGFYSAALIVMMFTSAVDFLTRFRIDVLAAKLFAALPAPGATASCTNNKSTVSCLKPAGKNVIACSVFEAPTRAPRTLFRNISHFLLLPKKKMDRIFTSGVYDTAIYEPRRFVSATHTEAVSVFRGLVAGIGGLIGGKSDTMNKKVEDVMQELIKKMAHTLGANEKIVGVQFQFTEFGRTEQNVFLSGIATGTVIGLKSGGMARNSPRKSRRNRRFTNA